MSFITSIAVHRGRLYTYTEFKDFVCLDKNDCKMLLKELETIKKKYEKRFVRYQDIQMGGEATERQQTMLMHSKDDLDRIIGIISDIKRYLKNENR